MTLYSFLTGLCKLTLGYKGWRKVRETVGGSGIPVNERISLFVFHDGHDYSKQLTRPRLYQLIRQFV